MRHARLRVAVLAPTIAIVVATALVPALAGPAVLTVDTFEDTFDGSCTDGDCSLRDAVASVTAGGTVRVVPGFYALDRSGTGPDTGDIDLDRPVTIVGTGETGSFLDASGLGDRVFDTTVDVTLRRLTLLSGGPVGAGGLVRAQAGALELVLVTTFEGTARDGGAVAVGEGAAASIDRSWIFGGTAGDRGGGLYVRGVATVTRSTISGNRSGWAGGGVFVAPSASLSVEDATISNNVAVQGGGIRAIGDVDLFSSTLATNRADVGGGVLVSSTSVTSVTNSVFARNTASERGPLCVRRLSSGGGNVSDVRGCGLAGPRDLAGADPGLGALGQHGGPTPTHALRADSPALGRGRRCHAADQRGAPRSDCDSGSYELVRCLGRPVTIVGTPGPDELSGGLGRDVFLGLGGDDEFQGSLDVDRACGGNGDDRLIGGPGDDRLAGNGGRDELLGEGGADVLDGGLGADVCRGGAGPDVIRRCETVSS
jgi:CSLREA domain-containing protein